MNPKVAAATLAAAVTTIIATIVERATGAELGIEFWGSVTTVLTAAAGYLKSE